MQIELPTIDFIYRSLVQETFPAIKLLISNLAALFGILFCILGIKFFADVSSGRVQGTPMKGIMTFMAGLLLIYNNTTHTIFFQTLFQGGDPPIGNKPVT